jgi:hypothetical protein
MRNVIAVFGLLASIALLGILLPVQPASAALIAGEGFAYAAGDLSGQNGGSAACNAAWSADSTIDVDTRPSWTLESNTWRPVENAGVDRLPMTQPSNRQPGPGCNWIRIHLA